MPNLCPQCGADPLAPPARAGEPPDAARCGVCGASMVSGETPDQQFTRQDIFGYSIYVIGLLLVAIALPCLVGLLCLLLGR